MAALVRIFTPNNALAEAVDSPNGLSPEALAAQAEVRVATLRPQLLAEVTTLRSQLAALAAGDETEVFGHARELGAVALSICEIAAAADLPAVGEAARGIHAMTESLMAAGVWHTEALMLHVEALRLFSAAAGPLDTGSMLDGLAAMRRRVGVVE